MLTILVLCQQVILYHFHQLVKMGQNDLSQQYGIPGQDTKTQIGIIGILQCGNELIILFDFHCNHTICTNVIISIIFVVVITLVVVVVEFTHHDLVSEQGHDGCQDIIEPWCHTRQDLFL